jgi:type III secretion protein R
MGVPDPAVTLPLLIVLGLLPVAVVMLTSYTKIVVVFSLLRNALGLQQVPPTMVTNGLALVLTWYVMYPVGLQMLDAMGVDRNAPSVPSLSTLQVLDRAKEPMRAFLDKHAKERERVLRLHEERCLRAQGLISHSPTQQNKTTQHKTFPERSHR